MKFAVYQVSRKGGRARNEDRLGYCYTQEAGLFALADGMGGHPEGGKAAQIALQAMASRFQLEARPRLADPLRFLESACLAGHSQLLRYATDKGMQDNPRTTVVGCVVQDHTAYWAHCGDSRLYLVRGGRLTTRTRDHSYAEMHAAVQVLPTAQSVNRNVLFTCLGSPGRPIVDTSGPVALLPGDRILLCSDGLWGSVDDDEITRQLAEYPVARSVPMLAEKALRVAGDRSDNVSLLAVEWEAAEDPDAASGVSTQAIGDEVFASTIQATDPQPVDDLDDAEIERSIREINEAIQRSARRP